MGLGHGTQIFVAVIFAIAMGTTLSCGMLGIAWIIISTMEYLFGFKCSRLLQDKPAPPKTNLKLHLRPKGPENPHVSAADVQTMEGSNGTKETTLYYSGGGFDVLTRTLNDDLAQLTKQHEHEQCLLQNPASAVLICLEPLSGNCRYLAGCITSGGGRLVWNSTKVSGLRFRLDSPALRSYLSICNRAGLEPFVVSSRAQKIRQVSNPGNRGGNHDTSS